MSNMKSFCISACNCNSDGSLGVACDENGRCVCRPGVLGVKCDQCGENRFNLSAGCTRKCDAIESICKRIFETVVRVVFSSIILLCLTRK